MSKFSSLLKKWSDTSLVLRIVIGLVIGAVLGLVCPKWTAVGILGQVFVSALKAIAPVLVALLVASSIAKAKGGLGARFRTVITLYLVSTLCAAVFAVVASFLFPVTIKLQGAEGGGSAPGGLSDVFLTLLTNMVMNPVQALAQANYIGILFWAIILGFALKLLASERTIEVFSDLADVVSQIVRWVIQFAPFGILGLVFSSVSESGLEIFRDYGKLLLLLVGCMCCTAFPLLPCSAYSFIFLPESVSDAHSYSGSDAQPALHDGGGAQIHDHGKDQLQAALNQHAVRERSARAHQGSDFRREIVQHKEQDKGDQAAEPFSVEKGAGHHIRQHRRHDRIHPGNHYEQRKQQEVHLVQFNLRVEGAPYILNHGPELFQLMIFAQEQTEIPQGQQRKKRTGQQHGKSVFQHLGTQNGPTAVGRHEQHIALLGAHIPVKNHQGLYADGKYAKHGREGQKRNTNPGPIRIIPEHAHQEHDLRDQRKGQYHQFGRPGLPEFIFDQLAHEIASTCP